MDTSGRHAVTEAGQMTIWAEVEHAWQRWRDCDRPGWDRFGVTVSADQWVWLDHAAQMVATVG